MRNDVSRVETLYQDEAMELFDPYLDNLIKIVEYGWTKWEDLRRRSPDICVDYSDRARANCVYCSMFEEAKRVFDGNPDIRVVYLPGNSPALFEFRGRALLGFKKLDDNLSPRSYPTSLQKDLKGQIRTGGNYLFDLPDLPYVAFGYRLKNDPPEIRDILMVYTRGNGPVEWAWSITGGAPAFQPRLIPEPKLDRPTVKAKNVHRKKAEGDGAG